MDSSATAVVDLLPHGPKMTLIDRLVAYDGSRSVAVVDVTPDSPFFAGAGVPAWIGIEYMAQTVAAHAGFEARLRGEPPAIGFLLGTRLYECSVPEFPVGATLKIAVERVLVDGAFGSFACTIESDRVLAKAVLNTYQPGEAELAKIRERQGAGR